MHNWMNVWPLSSGKLNAKNEKAKMIRTITDYLYVVQHCRPHIELQLARRKALKLGIATVAALIVLWVLWL